MLLLTEQKSWIAICWSEFEIPILSVCESDSNRNEVKLISTFLIYRRQRDHAPKMLCFLYIILSRVVYLRMMKTWTDIFSQMIKIFRVLMTHYWQWIFYSSESSLLRFEFLCGFCDSPLVCMSSKLFVSKHQRMYQMWEEVGVWLKIWGARFTSSYLMIEMFCVLINRYRAVKLNIDACKYLQLSSRKQFVWFEIVIEIPRNFRQLFTMNFLVYLLKA